MYVPYSSTFNSFSGFPFLVMVALMSSKTELCQASWKGLLLFPLLFLFSFFPSSLFLIGSSVDGLPLRPGAYRHKYYVNSELISVFAHRIIVRRGHCSPPLRYDELTVIKIMEG